MPHLKWRCNFFCGIFFPNCGNFPRPRYRINPACLQGEKYGIGKIMRNFEEDTIMWQNNVFFFSTKLCSFYGKDFSKKSTIIRFRTSMILSQIVIVSPGTDLVKHHDSQSRTNDSQLKKQLSPKLKMLGPLCSQTVNLKIESKSI